MTDEALLEYWAGNPSVEITHGHLRLAAPQSDVAVFEEGCVVLASSVPCYMSPPEFCDFVGAFAMETHRQFRHCRILHGHSPEEYLVAMWMASPELASGLIEKFDNVPYNALEAAICRLQRVVGCSQALLSAEEKGHSVPVVAQLAAAHPAASPAQGPVKTPSRSPLRSSPLATATELAQGAVPRKLFADAGELEGLDMDMRAAEELFVGLLPVAAAAPVLRSPRSPSRSPPPQVNSPRNWRKPDSQVVKCSVCLEPIESQPDTYQLSELGGGVPLTILCGHTFHARCLARWCDATCPVCRFQQHPYQVSCCDICGRSDALHICLVCGFIGCVGADDPLRGSTLVDDGASSAHAASGHAQQHFEATRHTYALEVHTQRVWDYAGNGYVHRLLMNSEDGKMVEHSAPSGAHFELRPEMPDDWAAQAAVGATSTGGLSRSGRHLAAAAGDTDGAKKTGKKQELLVSEFNSLLASQMTAQRRYYEEKQREQEKEQQISLAALMKKKSLAAAATEEMQGQLQHLALANGAAEEDIVKLAAQEDVMLRQLRALEGLNEKIAGEQRSYEAAQEDVRAQARQAKEKRSQEVQELQQQLKDLELYIQMQRRCERSHDAADLQGGVVVITESDTRGTGRGRRTRRRG
mmetsp:Transcript_7367/g.13067  ORF Transcript_7367/g.13067 Transcript_7367/m.13067 type:complete len:638 (-) Transcript_7367:29-1942(-)